MHLWKITHTLALGAALAVGLCAAAASAAAVVCEDPIPTPVAGRNCGGGALAVTGVAREAGEGQTRYRYKVNLTAGEFSFGVPIDASGNPTQSRSGGQCGLAVDGPVSGSSFGPEITCETRVARTAVKLRYMACSRTFCI